MKGLRLYKKEKLCSATAIEALFDRSAAAAAETLHALAYPLRAVWRQNPGRRADCPQFLIVIPKKRMRHAVDRVALRRRVREAYRLNRELLDRTARTDIALIWVADTAKPYADIERSMRRLLSRINDEPQS